MAVGISRWLVMRCFTTTSASAKALSTSPPSWWNVKAMLSGHSGCTAGAPGASAFSGSVDGGQRLVIHFDQVGGIARRCSGPWPPPRPPDGRRNRRDPAPAGDGAARAGRAGKRRRAPGPTFSMSAPVKTAATPGSSSAGLVLMDLILRRAVRAAHDAGVVHAGHLDVVHVGGGAGDQARIFAAADALADQQFRSW